jgi:trypsin
MKKKKFYYIGGNRIVNGVPAAPNSIPYIVGVYYYGKYICGGSLISRNYVLSAAHCVRGLPVASISVAVGDVNSQVLTRKSH